MQSPVKKEYITQSFGGNAAAYAKFGLKGHNGIDFRAFLPNGERCYDGGKSEVFAPHDGKILENVFDAGGFGNYIKIESDKEGSVLAHFSSLSPCKVGSTVKQGQLVGYQGTTGNSTGIHLHWGYYKIPRDRSNGYNGYIDQKGLYQPYTVQITAGTMPENTDLNKVLTYYKVKTSDELIKMVDEQLGFLKSERESNQKLNSQIEGLKTTISEANKKFSTFVQNIVDKLNPIHPIMGMVDETVCLGLIDEVVAQVSQLGSQLSKQEKIAQEKERELTDKNNELLRQIEQLQKEKNAIQSQVDKLQKGLDQVKQDQQTQKQEQADFDAFNKLINTIKQFVKGLYGKK